MRKKLSSSAAVIFALVLFASGSTYAGGSNGDGTVFEITP